jgi:hypothetical protein
VKIISSFASSTFLFLIAITILIVNIKFKSITKLMNMIVKLELNEITRQKMIRNCFYNIAFIAINFILVMMVVFVVFIDFSSVHTYIMLLLSTSQQMIYNIFLFHSKFIEEIIIAKLDQIKIDLNEEYFSLKCLLESSQAIKKLSEIFTELKTSFGLLITINFGALAALLTFAVRSFNKYIFIHFIY